MKNWRNGPDDYGPPFHHDDARPRFTKLRMGNTAAVFGPGPFVVPVHPEIPLDKLVVHT